MFEYLFAINGEKRYKLDVLKDNIPAIKLYEKMSFSIEKTIKGFNANCKEKPVVYTMVKNVNY